ncbi:MAG: hypothetical protein JW830_03715 [Bacteroidales bacterium]|nr:hypothetical protein [Bacteroidales bacterium]
MKAFKVLFCSSIIFLSCEKSESVIEIDPGLSYEFNGNFITSIAFQYGTVFLKIESGRYYCTTDLPFGKGAGRLVLSHNEIEFIDTLFFPVPAIYGPSWVLSGKHTYTFNGSKLKLYKKLNVGSINYDLAFVLDPEGVISE